MSERTIKIFTTPQEFPCGADSSCCGPIGQTEEEVRILRQGLAEALNLPVTVIYVKDGLSMREHRQVLTLLHSFGWGILPIIMIDDDIVGVGFGTVEEIAAAVRRKLDIDGDRPDQGVGAAETGSH